MPGFSDAGISAPISPSNGMEVPYHLHATAISSVSTCQIESYCRQAIRQLYSESHHEIANPHSEWLARLRGIYYPSFPA